MIIEKKTPAALAGADRDDADQFRDRPYDIRFLIERRDRPERERVVAIYGGNTVAHARLRGGRWHVYTKGDHRAYFGLGTAVLAMRDAVKRRAAP